jgi:acyl-CoA synthetase (NDP forming)
MTSTTTASTSRGPLASFRDPASVAVVGASDDQAKWGHWLARGALSGRDRRSVYLINRSSATVLGERAYANVGELPVAPELVVLCVRPQFVGSVTADALAAGARAFLGITAGVPDERGLAQQIAAAGARIVGPNSLGIYDSASKLQLAWGNFTPGPLAIVSQSGQLGSEIAYLAARSSLGISRFVSIGNQIDVSAAEVLADLASHEETHTIALYLESFSDGELLVRTLRMLAEAGKKTIVLTTGGSDGSRRLAQSHTGSLTSAMDTIDAACRAAGAIRVSTPTHLVSLACYLETTNAPRGRRLAILSDSGGQGGIAADIAAAHRLDIPVLSEPAQTALASMLPDGAAVANPVDLAGAGEADLFVYSNVAAELARSGEADAVLFSGYLGRYGEDTPQIAEAELAVIDRLAAAAKESGTPLIVHTMSNGSVATAQMVRGKIAVYPAVELAIEAIGSAATLAEWPGRDIQVRAADETGVIPGYWWARQFLAARGISVPAAVRVTSGDDVALAVVELATPYVLKAGWLAHKSEHGGVQLGLTSADEVGEAFDSMRARLGDGEYVVEEQDTRPNTIELLVGGRRDRDFGPLVVVGAGGTETELHRDICVELAPVDHALALSMIRRLRCFPLLNGWRGKPGVDIEALASIVVSVSEVIASHTRISELELNPVRVGPDGARAVDALIAIAGDAIEKGRS